MADIDERIASQVWAQVRYPLHHTVVYQMHDQLHKQVEVITQDHLRESISPYGRHLSQQLEEQLKSMTPRRRTTYGF